VVGQLAEWEVWVELVVRSHGRLHVFLPLLDRGVDALVHRIDDGSWLPVQVKGRSQLRSGALLLTVAASALVDSKAIIVGVFVEDDHLGPQVLVIRERDFRRLAGRSENRRGPLYDAQISLVPGKDTRWARFIFPLEGLAKALLADVKPTGAVPVPRRRGNIARAVGFRGETEVVRRLADSNELTLFRPFPDLETAEVAVLHEKTRRVLGIQVKTIGVDKRHLHNTVDIDLASFRPSPQVWVVVVAWDRDRKTFRTECLVIPSMEAERVIPEYRGHLVFPFAPDSGKPTRLDPYRRPLGELGANVESELAKRSSQLRHENGG
jgi:hypothetical protein